MDQEPGDAAEARYELVISVDARGSGGWDDTEKPRMRARVYRVLESAFGQAKVARDAVHLEDRGDGVLVSVAGRVAVTRLLGLWLVEVHEHLREENRELRTPLGLRIGLHVGPVRHDARGISGRAVDLACRLADAPVARELLAAEGADLVVVVSHALYEDVVSSGGKFIHPERYAPARLLLKEGEVTAWCQVPGRPAPKLPTGGPDRRVVPPRGVRAEAPAADPDDDAFDQALDSASGAGDGDDCGGGEARQEARRGAADEDDLGTRPETVRYTVHGDLSQHQNNVYHQPVHIGRNTGGAGPRKD
ncbi:hypothetical protein ACMA1D_08920 [Streptomyces sp. 796.1]|uniref:hypothetical protein n=1 Tax=Streptomyces sp. 796.1 TaxID=3163029 RepID=UPI0039C8ED7F